MACRSSVTELAPSSWASWEAPYPLDSRQSRHQRSSMPCLPARSWDLSSPRSLRLLAPAALARFSSSTSKAGRRCTIFRSKRADISFDLVRKRPSRRPLSPRRCRPLLEIFEMPWVEEVKTSRNDYDSDGFPFCCWLTDDSFILLIKLLGRISVQFRFMNSRQAARLSDL